jgi:UDPglucose 6-dehydrogenase
VVCVDNDIKKIQLLKNGTVPIFEPGLEPLLKRNVEKGRLVFTDDIEKAITGSEIIFIAVGTPPGEDGSADLKHVITVAADIGRILNEYVVIATKSTVPVGTAEKVRQTIQGELDKRKVRVPFDMASNPNFSRRSRRRGFSD